MLYNVKTEVEMGYSLDSKEGQEALLHSRWMDIPDEEFVKATLAIKELEQAQTDAQTKENDDGDEKKE
jgi:hypothetical protein